MRIHDIQDVDGRVLAFEVPSFFLDRRAVRQIVQAIPGATLLAYRPFKERLCEFKVGGVGFLVHEHWGESDRYWIGPVHAGWTPQLGVIRDTFARARPFLWFVRF
jgi:hypothetical protein